MIIKILGTGCTKCNQLEKNVKIAIESAGIKDCEVKKITELNEIMNYGVMMTPALVIDEIVKSTGRLLTPKEIAAIIK